MPIKETGSSKQSAMFGMSPWQELLSARGTGARQTALFIGRIRGRLSVKNMGNWPAGFITTLSASPFVVSLNASRTIGPP